MYTIVDVLFFAAGILLLAHLILCAVAARWLDQREPVVRELFGPATRRLRLLRLRYCLPWLPLPFSRLSPSATVVVVAVRLTGFLFSISLLAFIGFAYVLAWR
jgi:hypothetical protein